MNNKIFFAVSTSIFTYLLITLCSCANIIPPSGGPRDTLAPICITAFPKDSSLNFNSKKITLTFDEYIEVRDVQQNVVVNPIPKSNPTIEGKLRNVFITLKDSLEPNTTYSINFGDAIKDVNESNSAKNKVYVFSTGKHIDSNEITGNVILAQDGKIDTTLIAVLHTNISDTAVVKLKPKYMAKLDGKGNFKFTNLPNSIFKLYILPNDYTKRYDDSTKLFAFLDSPIHSNTNIKQTLYAYRQAEIQEKKPVISQADAKKLALEKLKFTIGLMGKRFDILDTALSFSFNKMIKVSGANAIQLTDTLYNKIENYTLNVDSNKTTILLKYNFLLNTKYCVIMNKDSISDTLKNSLSKQDTIRFTTYKEDDYGSVKIKTNNTISNEVVQILSNGKIVATYSFTNKIIYKKLFKPGEYELRILKDENKNLKWDTGNYSLKMQPEKVINLSTKLMVKANWDNEIEVNW